MLFGTVMMLVQTVVGFFAMMLLVRTLMRFLRISFVNQVGQFVLVTTNWAVLPLNKVLPSVGRVDLASLVPAWALEVLPVLLFITLSGRPLGNPGIVSLGVLLIGAFELVHMALMLLTGLVILSAVLSWVNPYAPIAPAINQLISPFLRPFQRLLPPISGFDFSPLLLLLVLQVVQFLFDGWKGGFYRLLYL